jgi:hypothetical protein
MVEQDLRVNGEFYIAPSYNRMLEQGFNITYFNIGTDRLGMYGIGTPDYMNYFVNLMTKPKKLQDQLGLY